MIRSCRTTDATQIGAIYNHYVREAVATFEEVPIASPEIARRIDEVTSQWPWLVYEESGLVVGYAYATRWKERSAYRLSVETTIYLAPECMGRGVGTMLYGALLDELRTRGIARAPGLYEDRRIQGDRVQVRRVGGRGLLAAAPVTAPAASTQGGFRSDRKTT